MLKKIALALLLALTHHNAYATKAPIHLQQKEVTLQTTTEQKRNFLERYFVRDTKAKTACNVLSKLCAAGLVYHTTNQLIEVPNLRLGQTKGPAPIEIKLLVGAFRVAMLVPGIRELIHY